MHSKLISGAQQPRIKTVDVGVGGAVITPCGVLDDAEAARVKSAPGVTLYDDPDRFTKITAAQADAATSRVLYCGYMRWQWGHFLINTLPHFWWAVDAGIAKHYDYIVLSQQSGDPEALSGNFLTLFTLLGIADKIKFISEPTAFGKVDVAESAYRQRTGLNDSFARLCGDLRQRALATADTPPNSQNTKIFLTRSQLPSNRQQCAGYEMLDDLFADNGYEVIAPERMDIAELIRRFAGCTHIASISGSTAFNLIFAPASAKKIILERGAMPNDHIPVIAEACGGNLDLVDASLTPRSVSIGSGPWLIFPTEEISAYVSNNAMLPIREKYNTTQWHAAVYKRYRKQYFRINRWRRPFDAWMNDYAYIMDDYVARAKQTLRPVSGNHLCRRIKSLFGR